MVSSGLFLSFPLSSLLFCFILRSSFFSFPFHPDCFRSTSRASVTHHPSITYGYLADKGVARVLFAVAYVALEGWGEPSE